MDKGKVSFKIIKGRNRGILPVPKIGFIGEDYDRFYFLETSDGLDEFLILEPLYILYNGLEFNNTYKSIYYSCFGHKFPYIKISYKELSICFFIELLGINYHEEDIYSLIFILFEKGYICLKKNNKTITFDEFNKGIDDYKKNIHIFNKEDRIYITIDGANFIKLLFNNSENTIIKDYKNKNIKKGTYVNENTGEVYFNGKLIGCLSINTNPFKFFIYLYNNKGNKCSHEDIKNFIIGKNKVLSSTTQGFSADMKRKLDINIRKLVSSFNGGYRIKE